MNITNDIVTDYLNFYYKPLTAQLMNLREKAEKERVPIILRETESFLRVLLGIVKPKRILEIGCAVGYSAMFFAEATKGKVVTIEKSEEMYREALSNISKMGYSDYVSAYLGDGEEVIKSLIEKNTPAFDIIFIDAAKSHYKRFFEASRGLCTRDTIIISDNVLFKGRTASDIYDPTGKYKTNIKKMREYVDFISHDSSLDNVIISCGDGLSITRFI